MNKAEVNDEKFCKYCERAKTLSDESLMICAKKGIVPADSCCRRFRYDPLKRVPKRKSTEFELEFVDI